MVSLLTERAALDEAHLAASGAGEPRGATSACHLSCRVAVHGGDREARRALHVHEASVWALDKAAPFVLGALRLDGGIAEIRVKETHFAANFVEEKEQRSTKKQHEQQLKE